MSDEGVEFFPELVGTRPAAYFDCPTRLDMPIRIRRFLQSNGKILIQRTAIFCEEGQSRSKEELHSGICLEILLTLSLGSDQSGDCGAYSDFFISRVIS